jgi:hypothetical protein
LDPFSVVPLCLWCWENRSDSLVYAFEQMLPSDLSNYVRKAAGLSAGMTDTAVARVSGVLSQVKNGFVDPLVHSIEQPIAGMAHEIGQTATVLRYGTYAAGGWFLWNAYQNYFVGPERKRVLEQTIDESIRRNNRRRR